MEIWPKILALFLVPPGLIVTIGIIGFLLYIKWPAKGALIYGLGFVTLFVLSLPLTGQQLMAGLETAPAVALDAGGDPAHAPQAIVVLGGGRYADAPEYGGDTVNAMTLVRLRYAAELQRRTGLPILVSGGAPYGEHTPEAELMRAVLEKDFRVPVRWVEPASDNTFQNAVNSARLLQAAGVGRVYLVTQAWHMPRALWAFTEAGLYAVPAPTGFTTLDRAQRGIFGYLPSIQGLYWSAIALHERLGLMWYTRHYRAPAAPGPGAAR